MSHRPAARMIAIACASALAGCVQPGGRMTANDDSAATLRTLAEANGILIGAAAGVRPLRDLPEYGETLAREFNLVTTENALKFGPLRPSRDRFEFAGADAIVDFARQHGMKVRGHTLVWHFQLPKWIGEGDLAPKELETVLREHIRTVAGRYRGRVDYWDVVNEGLADDGTLRESPWSKALGPDYIERAFRWAHEADPAAKLFYNEYGCEGLGAKSDAVYELVRELQRKGAPIAGVGLQMHIDLGARAWLPDLAANMRRLAALGLEVHITELDIRLPDPATPELLERQADLYGEILDVFLSTGGCTAFIMWGFTDASSWVPSFFKGFGAALPFDAQYRPKPAYHRLREVLRRHAS